MSFEKSGKSEKTNRRQKANRMAKMAEYLKALFPDMKRYRLQMAGALFAILVSAATVLVFGWGLKVLVDKGFSDHTGHTLNMALGVMLGIIILMAVTSYARFSLVYWTAEKLIADLRKRIYSHILTLDPAYFETHKTGEQVSRINTDTTVLKMVATTNLPMGTRHVLTIIGGIIMMIVVSPIMTGTVLLAVPIVVAPIVLLGRKVRARSKDTQTRIGDIGSYSHETIQGIQTIQTFGYEDKAAATFDNMSDSIFFSALQYIRVRAVLTAFVIFIVFSAIGVLLWMGGHRVLTDRISAGDLSAFLFYAVTVAGAVGAMSEAASAFSQAMGAADRIVSLLRRQPTLKGSFAPKPAPRHVEGAIAFDHVTLAYPSRPDHIALCGVSFEIEAGEVVALVGPSGAGKSSIFQLLQRFYDPKDGKIVIDGFNVADYKPRDIRRYMGVVSQDPAIFSGTIADNIRIGDPGATDEEIRAAAKLAQAHGFISALPDGYDTLVGERGSLLSGGQKQRVAIARALLKDPRVLLLDEATSALDSSNEQAVMLALKNLMKGRTTIVIAHHFSTVQNADKIIVLDEGRKIAEGKHADLYGTNSLYTHLAGLQMAEEKEAG